MKILIVKTSAIGDVIHTLPALHALRYRYPDARIDWLVEEAAADIVKGHPALDRVLVSGRKRWIADWRAGRRRQAIRAFRRFVGELRRTTYDLLIDFQGLLKSGIFVTLARAHRKVGFGRGMEHAEMSYLFLNERIPAVSMDMHAVDRELHLLAAIGVECPQVRFDLPVTDAHRAVAARLLGEEGIGDEHPLVAINPMTTWPTKHWRSERFAQVADRLMTAGLAVVFTGGPDDRLAVDRICATMQNKPVNLAGRTSLLELAALYERCRLLLTTDTGPMHVAAAVGTPVVALFGPTAPWRTGPYGKAHRVVRRDMECSPCFKKRCPREDGVCMTALAVETVERSVLDSLEQNR